eukprot:6216699-Amphidinium_carterae.1
MDASAPQDKCMSARPHIDMEWSAMLPVSAHMSYAHKYQQTCAQPQIPYHRKLKTTKSNRLPYTLGSNT